MQELKNIEELLEILTQIKIGISSLSEELRMQRLNFNNSKERRDGNYSISLKPWVPKPTSKIRQSKEQRNEFFDFLF